MIRLIGAELNRLLSRRLTLIAVLAVVAVVGLFQLAVSSAVAPPSPERVAAAQQGYERDLKSWQDNHEQFEQQCVDAGNPPDSCVLPEPTLADYGLEPTPYSDVVGIGVTLSVVMAMLAVFLVASSLIGAEYSTGSLGNWLTFVPRRERVFAAKTIALALGSAAIAAVAGLLMVGVSAIITVAVGQPLTGVGSVVASAARGIPLVVFAALIGFCVAMLTRHTVAALGVLLGYGLLVLGLNIASFLVPALSRLKRWQLETNIQAFLGNGTSYSEVRRTVTEQGVSLEQIEHTLALGPAAAYLAVVLVVVLAATLLVFRRRDVT